MDERDWLAERFEEQRPHLRTVAYRMLGSVNETDDAVQEAWLRLARIDARGREPASLADDGRGPGVPGHAAHPALAERGLVGSWLPEPVVTLDGSPNPEQEALIADSVGLALLVVLEALTPGQRLASVLHDMFGVPFTDIGEILDRSPAAARQLASQGRRRVAEPILHGRQPGRAAARGRRVHGRLARRRLRGAHRRARPGRRLPLRRRPRQPARAAARAWRRGRCPPGGGTRHPLRAARSPRAGQRRPGRGRRASRQPFAVVGFSVAKDASRRSISSWIRTSSGSSRWRVNIALRFSHLSDA